MNKWPFTDLHSFKDFVVFVKMCAPNNFPMRDGVPAEYQWTLEIAFRAIREGLEHSKAEIKSKSKLERCLAMCDAAYGHYSIGEHREGFAAMANLRRELGTVRT